MTIGGRIENCKALPTTLRTGTVCKRLARFYLLQSIGE